MYATVINGTSFGQGLCQKASGCAFVLVIQQIGCGEGVGGDIVFVRERGKGV